MTTHAWHLFMFRYDAAAFAGMPRADFIRALQAEGIPCTAGYLPLHRSEQLRDETTRLLHTLGRARTPSESHSPVSLPLAEQAGREGVWLYQYMLLGEESDVDDIVEAVSKIQRSTASSL